MRLFTRCYARVAPVRRDVADEGKVKREKSFDDTTQTGVKKEPCLPLAKLSNLVQKSVEIHVVWAHDVAFYIKSRNNLFLQSKFLDFPRK